MALAREGRVAFHRDRDRFKVGHVYRYIVCRFKIDKFQFNLRIADQNQTNPGTVMVIFICNL